MHRPESIIRLHDLVSQADLFARSPTTVAAHGRCICRPWCMWAHLIDNRLITLHGVLVFIGLSIYVIGSRTRHQRRHPSAAIAWVVSLGLMPYVALFPKIMSCGSA